MNPNIKIKRIYSSFGVEKKRTNIKIKFKYKKNSLNKILKDINIIKHEIFDNKSNNIFNYNFNNFFHKPKTAVKRYNNIFNNFIPEEEINTIIKGNQNEDNNNNNKKLKWNYSYNNNPKNKIRRNFSNKKIRIINIIKKKETNIIDDWQKPKMVKILEKNSLIEEAIVTKPWKFFPYFDNNEYQI